MAVTSTTIGPSAEELEAGTGGDPVVLEGSGTEISVPEWISRAEAFQRSGDDLLIVGPDGQKAIIPGFFSSGVMPKLVTFTGSAAWASTAPDIQGSSIEIAEDTSASGKMTSTDVSGTATYTVVGSPQNGTVNLDSSTGHWTYTPTADYQGTDSFTLRASGATSGIDDETVSVQVGKAPALVDNFSLSFDGTDDVVTGQAPVSDLTSFTAEAWLKWDGTGGHGNAVMSIGESTANGFWVGGLWEWLCENTQVGLES